ATDAMVETVLRVGCLSVDIVLPMTIEVDGQEDSINVNLCAKYIEGYLLRNNQYIRAETTASGTRIRSVVLSYDTNQSLLSQLIDWQAPNSTFASLETELSSLTPLNVSTLPGLVWDPVTTQEASYFSTAKEL